MLVTPTTKEGSMDKAVVTLPDVSLAAHHCETAVLGCIDFRFRQADQTAVEKLGYTDFDMIKWPGGSKALASDPAMAENLLDVFRKVCLGLHNIKRLVVINHWDCGGYGGSKAFASAEEEATTHEQDLRKAKTVIQAAFPELEVILMYSRETDQGLQYFQVSEVAVPAS